MNNSPGFKTDRGKLRMDLLPHLAITKVAEVMTVSVQPIGKYPERNWEKGMEWSRLYRAALRHLFAWWMGQDNDPDDGLSHLAHAACCILFLVELSSTKPEDYDDRPKSSVNE